MCFRSRNLRRSKEEWEDAVLNRYVLYELEQSFVRPNEIEKRLELARQLREGRPNRPRLRERVLLLLRGLLISLGEDLKARSLPPIAGGSSACQSIELMPTGSYD